MSTTELVNEAVVVSRLGLQTKSSNLLKLLLMKKSGLIYHGDYQKKINFALHCQAAC